MENFRLATAREYSQINRESGRCHIPWGKVYSKLNCIADGLPHLVEFHKVDGIVKRLSRLLWVYFWKQK